MPYRALIQAIATSTLSRGVNVCLPVHGITCIGSRMGPGPWPLAAGGPSSISAG